MSRVIHMTKQRWLVAACASAALAGLGQTAPSERPREPDPKRSPASQPARETSAPAGERIVAPAAADPSVRTPPQVSAEDLLKEFQKDRPQALPIPPTGEPDEGVPLREAPPSAAGRRMPDGFFLVDRAGRLTREGEWWVFVFEGYNETHPEPPMKMLPNQLLERMVIDSESGGAGTVFLVSGEVTEFKSENYLLLRKLLRRRGHGNLEK